MKTMISDLDHGDRVNALESGFIGLKDSMGQHQVSIRLDIDVRF